MDAGQKLLWMAGNTTPATLADFTDLLTPLQRSTLHVDLMHYAVFAAQVSAYVEARTRTVDDHENGVKAWNRMRKSVRKLFGFNTTPAVSF